MEITKVIDVKEEYLRDLRRKGILVHWDMRTETTTRDYGDDPFLSNFAKIITLCDMKGREHTGTTGEYLVVNDNRVAILSPALYGTLFPEEI
ncbi:hypothetical protein [Rummeliibacillus sp. TYF-LIM-RU47]|uniref:hypothetical protein n=1 Tax=Rummeliibacillus sp. TYF-LIM-RU47 TaxID=2608406 RepID=UPI0012398989|nr:hypothetical protein [Rummeliibacillus sp. TYF-LIM-RU47]